MKFKKRADKWLSGRFYRNDLMIGGKADSKAYISFTFDDFSKSAATTAAEILNGYGVKATYYGAFSLMDKTETGKVQFSNHDLTALAGTGHEIGCHTYHHLDCEKEPYRKVKESIRKNSEAFREILPECNLSSFSYPFGRYSFLTKKYVSEHFSTGRTTRAGLNCGLTDASLLKANKLYSDTHSIDHCKALIDEAVKTKSWLIFYTHDVEKEPSQFGCTPVYFEEVLKYAKLSGSIILPVGKFITNNLL